MHCRRLAGLQDMQQRSLVQHGNAQRHGLVVFGAGGLASHHEAGLLRHAAAHLGPARLQGRAGLVARHAAFHQASGQHERETRKRLGQLLGRFGGVVLQAHAPRAQALDDGRVVRRAQEQVHAVGDLRADALDGCQVLLAGGGQKPDGRIGGSQKLGCLTLPMSSGNTDRQLQFMEDLGSTILCCTPSYAAYLAESIHERGLQDKIHLKAGIFGAEAWSEQMRQDIQKSLGIKAYDIYGLTELSGPGVAYECSAQTGMHINEDHFIAEIIDPDTGEVLPDGEKGELVFTSISKKAFPLLRYRTRDICILSREKCSCGRTHVRMTKPLGRTDDMLIVRGVNVFPTQIETVLMNNGYAANYQIIVDRENNNDTLDVHIEMTPDIFTDNVGKITQMQKALSTELHSMLGIRADVTLVAPKSIIRSEGKAVRIIDKRKI